MNNPYHLTLKLVSLSVCGLVLSGCNLVSSSSEQISNVEMSALPAPLTIAEILPSKGNKVCSNGGIRLVYGLDHDGNGTVGPYESIGMEYICTPSANTGSGQRVVVIGSGVPTADRERLIKSSGG